MNKQNYSQKFENLMEKVDEGLINKILLLGIESVIRKDTIWNSPEPEEMFYYDLIVKRNEDIFNFRRETVQQYIREKGIIQFQDEIINGMNKTCHRVTLDDNFKGHITQQMIRIRHDDIALLNFALDYVDKWEKYNKLFCQGTF